MALCNQSPREAFLTIMTPWGDRAVPSTDRRVTPWLLATVALVALIAALDLLLGPDVSLIAVLVTPPLAASLVLGARQTAAVSGLALGVAILLGPANDFFGDTAHFARVLPVAVAGILSTWAVGLRAQRERGAVLLGVQGSVSRILNESPSIEEAAPRILRTVGEALGWQVGSVWELEQAGDRMRAAVSWHAPGFDPGPFGSATNSLVFERGVGLPGAVWERSAPVSVPALGRDANFPRSQIAAQTGLASAFAFPIRRGDNVVGVVEFFSRARHAADRAQLEMLAGLGRQIGQYLERTRAEEQRAGLLEREHAARLTAERAERENTETIALLDTLIGRAPIGFAFIGPGLRILRINDALAATQSRSPEEMVGRAVSDAFETPPGVIESMRAVLEGGEPVIDAEVSATTPATPGVRRHWVASYYPVRGARADMLGVGVVVTEITSRKRAEARTSFLARAGAELTASLDYETTLRRTARLAVAELADICAIDLVGPDGRSRRVAVAHRDPARERKLREFVERWPTDPNATLGPAAAIRGGGSQLLGSIDDATLRAGARDDEHLQAVRELGLASAMVVPLTGRGAPLGAITLGSTESARVFDNDDLALAEELGRRAGTAVENARLYEDRSYIARTLQASLLPPRLPDVPGLDLAARYRAVGARSDVGGDFYDVFATGDQRWAAVVGDVLGKGPPAAALIGLARHTLRTAAMRDSDPARILSTLNEALHSEAADDAFLTAVYMTIDLSGDAVVVELTSAGHPLPLVLRSDGTLETVGQPGTLVGAMPTLALHPERVRLGYGDTLVTFTDGVPEARSEQGVFGERRLASLLESLTGATAIEVAERIEHDTVAFQGGRLRDDVAVLVLRRPPAHDREAVAAGGVEGLGDDV